MRASLPPVLADPLGGVGSTFSRCRRWLYGGFRRERRGRCFQGRKGPRCLARRERGSFRQGSFEGSVPLKIVDHPSPWSQGRGTGPGGMRRWRRLLVPRACARAVGMGLGVESSGWVGWVSPWVCGSSLRYLGWCSNGGDISTGVQVGSRGSCHFWEDGP